MYKKYHNIRNITETKKSRRKKAHQNHTSPLPLPISQLPPPQKKNTHTHFHTTLTTANYTNYYICKNIYKLAQTEQNYNLYSICAH